MKPETNHPEEEDNAHKLFKNFLILLVKLEDTLIPDCMLEGRSQVSSETSKLVLTMRLERKEEAKQAT